MVFASGKYFQVQGAWVSKGCAISVLSFREDNSARLWKIACLPSSFLAGLDVYRGRHGVLDYKK